MRVLQINSVCGTGSTGKIAVDLYHMLVQSGNECCIAYGRGEAPQGVYSYKIGSNADVILHGIKSRITDRHGFYSGKTTKIFLEWMKKYNPDVIHLHNLHGYYINIELLFEALKMMNKPVVWTLHDCWAFTGHCAHFDFCGCNKWKTVCDKCNQKKNYPTSILCDASFKNYMDKKRLFTSINNLQIITPSQWLADLVKQSFFKEFDVCVIPNGIDLAIFRPLHSKLKEMYGLNGKKIILGVANVWNERKGLNRFIKLSTVLNSSYQIILIGLNKRQIKELPYSIIGVVKTTDIDELVQWFSLADVYVNASVEETMGLTTVEALACGTPVIVYDRTAIPEAVNETCGVILQLGDGREIAMGIKRVEDKKCSREICRKRAFDFEKKQQYGQYLFKYQFLHNTVGDE